jgi:hypothetical protein
MGDVLRHALFQNAPCRVGMRFNHYPLSLSKDQAAESENVL